MKLFNILSVGIILLFANAKTYAQNATDSLQIIFNQYQFVQGDTLKFEAWVEGLPKQTPLQTLHVWIDNIETKQRYKFRYPFIKNYVKANLKLSDSLPSGTYAFNFLMQNQFLNIKGKIKYGDVNNDSLNYVATAKGKIPAINSVKINRDSSFLINDFLFLNGLTFSFSPTTKSKKNKNDYVIQIENPLDSVFTPIYQAKEFINIGTQKEIENTNAALTKKYIFENDDKTNTFSSVIGKGKIKTFSTVVVKGRTKTEAQKFDDENSRGMFAMGDTRVLDFLSTNEHLAFGDLYSYLQLKIPGLSTQYSADAGYPYLVWRNQRTDVYVDEVYVEDFSANDISLQSIAIVKVYNPGYRMGFSDALGGTIVIYTKRFGSVSENKLSNYTFYLRGYNNALLTEWKK